MEARQLFAVAVEDVRDLLFNCTPDRAVRRAGTIDRRLIYPNLLKRLGGELAKCADVIYNVLTRVDCSVCHKHTTSPCVRSGAAA